MAVPGLVSSMFSVDPAAARSSKSKAQSSRKVPITKRQGLFLQKEAIGHGHSPNSCAG
jgi:hypothetical protein